MAALSWLMNLDFAGGGSPTPPDPASDELPIGVNQVATRSGWSVRNHIERLVLNLNRGVAQ